MNQDQRDACLMAWVYAGLPVKYNNQTIYDMIITRPDVELDGLYTVSKAAAALHVDRHTIKRYAEKGLITFRKRQANGRPVTTGRQILRCWRSLYS